MNRIYLSFFLCLALLWVQTSTIWHSVVHPFHAEEASCDLYLAIEKQGYAPWVHEVLPPVFYSGTVFWVAAVPTFHDTRPLAAFEPRAPPSLS